MLSECEKNRQQLKEMLINCSKKVPKDNSAASTPPAVTVDATPVTPATTLSGTTEALPTSATPVTSNTSAVYTSATMSDADDLSLSYNIDKVVSHYSICRN